MRIPSIHESPTTSPRTNRGENVSSTSRRSSQASLHQQYSPVTPTRPTSSRSKRPSSSRLSINSNISTGIASNAGLGNLADELEDAWDPEFDESDSLFLRGLQEGDPNQALQSPTQFSELHDLDTTMTPQSPRHSRLLQPLDKPPSPSKQWASIGTAHRKTESLYDGSDYGPSSDDEAFDSIPPTLQRRIHDMEEITRISSNADSVSESGGVISRTSAALKDNLGDQSNIEAGATRLITAYTSMATHRFHQAREFFHTSHALTAANSLALFELPVETIELLIAELESLALTLPFISVAVPRNAAPSPLAALQSFANSTHDLFTTLHSLADTLTEDRQYLLNATRKLKSVRDMVQELAAEEELVETSMMLITAGDWDRRCRDRHAAKMAGEVLEGFKRSWSVDYTEDAWKPTVNNRRSIVVR